VRCLPDKIVTTRFLFFSSLLSMLSLCSCNGFNFDFSPDGQGSKSDDDECLDLYTATSKCVEFGCACMDESTIITQKIDSVIGCTSMGRSLGILEMGSFSFGAKIDLFAWINSKKPDNSVFEKYSELSIFSDRCGDLPLGESWDCNREPWMFVPALTNDVDLYVHVQTKVEDIVTVGYQILDRDKWEFFLPSASVPIVCDEAPGGFLLNLDDPTPLHGDEIILNLSYAAPAIEGVPWICSANSDGWRQAAFMIRNHFDSDVQILGVDIRSDGVSSSFKTPFHFALYSCDEKALLSSDTASKAGSCQDFGLKPKMNVLVKHWASPSEPEPLVVFILQIPPSTSPKLFLKFETVIVK